MWQREDLLNSFHNFKGLCEGKDSVLSVRIELGRGDGYGEGWTYLVVMFEVKGYGMLYGSGGPQKHISTSICVCV